jgi:hypothetical protein
MRIHDAFGDGETEPGAFAAIGSACRLASRVHKLLEHVRQHFGCDAAAVIRHPQHDRGWCCRGVDDHARFGGRVHHGVGDDIA